MRSRAYIRDVCWRKALRKRRIIRQFGHEYYDHLHQYSKNKIHCSCPDCSPKTRNRGKRRQSAWNYAPSLNYKHSELKRWVAMNMDERDYLLSCVDNTGEEAS